MVAGIGCIVQSALTLLVFFPRSIAQENGYTVLAQPSLPGGSNRSRQRRSLSQSGTGQRQHEYYNEAVPTAAVPMSQLSSMPSPEEDREHRRKAQEWIVEQQQGDLVPNTRAFTFGSRARNGSVGSPSGSAGGTTPRAAPRPLSGYSDDERAWNERNANRDTMPSVYSTDIALKTSSPPPGPYNTSNTAPPSYTPTTPITPSGSQRRPLVSAPSLQTVLEPDHSRTTTPEPLASGSRRQSQIPRKRPQYQDPSEYSPHQPGSPFEFDYVDLESASVRGGQMGDGRVDRFSRTSSTTKAALIPAGGEEGRRGRNELAHVPFEEMRAMGSRYSEMAVRRAAERGEEIHPYVRLHASFPLLVGTDYRLQLKSFRSPLDLYDSVDPR